MGALRFAMDFADRPPREQAAHLRALLVAGRPEEVVRLVDPARAGLLALDLLAEAQLDTGDAAGALATVERREAQGASSVSLGLRARALARLGRVAEVPSFLDAQPGLAPYLRRVILGEALLEAGEAAPARRAFEAAVAEHPTRRRGLLGLAEACGAMGDWVSGSAFAARLLDTRGDEEGPLSASYHQRLRRFFEGAGEEHHAQAMAEALSLQRAEAAALVGAAAAPRQEAAPKAVSSGPAVSPEEIQRAADLVRRHFGYAGLREGQGEVLARILRGEDVLALMPTGGGKSLCYQLPAVLSRGVTLVVSPLIALMKDQLDSLPAPMRAASVALTSELTQAQARRALDEIAAGRYRLVYAAPERLRNATFLAALRRAGVVRLVVDEAHCVSVWGHDFRPDYLGIADARTLLGSPPVAAFTATAPPRVERDIVRRLCPMTVVRASTARPNLRYEAILARSADDKLAHLVQLCRETPGPGIVYASSRAKCEQLAEALSRAGLRAAPYHAGLDDRTRRQEEFMEGRVDVLVATVAFGMGINKGDIRFVFHADPAESVESYSQESGRAGRDGLPARCVLLATAQDGGQLKSRARGDLPSAKLVHEAWGLLLASAGEDGYSLLDPAQVAALDPEDDVKPRVALSILAEAGAAVRLADAPRSVLVHGGDLPISGREVGLFEAARALGVAPEKVEPTLLSKEADGALFFQVGPRAILHKVTGSAEGAPAVLDRYAALAEQRGKEILDYVKTTRCRHWYLRRYFGEEGVPERCGSCDNCLGVAHELPEEGAGSEEEARRHVLNALSGGRGIGERNLIWHLRGDARSPPWADKLPARGSLGLRSESKVKALIGSMEEMGYVERATLEHGGTMLKLTPKGLDALFGERPLVVEAPPKREAPAGAEPSDVDDALLAALKAWRKARADEEGVPAYVVAHDATLRAIAAARPATESDLLAVKGMGPKKVEKYGKGIIEVVGRSP